nr:unnamed protein product [Digitaria exilis]
MAVATDASSTLRNHYSPGNTSASFYSAAYYSASSMPSLCRRTWASWTTSWRCSSTLEIGDMSFSVLSLMQDEGLDPYILSSSIGTFSSISGGR